MALISTFPAIPLTWECSVVFEAWATDWSGQVSGVVVDAPVLYGLDLTGGTPPVLPAPTVPQTWLPVPLEDQ